MIGRVLENIYWIPVLYLAFWFAKWLATYIRTVLKSRQIPGLPFYPIVGNLFDVSLDRESKERFSKGFDVYKHFSQF